MKMAVCGLDCGGCELARAHEDTDARALRTLIPVSVSLFLSDLVMHHPRSIYPSEIVTATMFKLEDSNASKS
jgi:hypothetical protein